MTAQLHLFGTIGPQRALGIKVRLPKPCKCGCHVGVLGPGKAMHAVEIRCSDCVTFVQWLSARTRDTLIRAAKSPHAPEVLALPRGDHEQS
jgi:hypothetical protein